ncbi:MAG TPA: sulfatase [Candidatus Paceibacterota bacterium]|nr:sulfatase [Verrucomicrobiota bacterium]HSA09831.1 sulfatase [Candidatus Paceibacterota bacterium]
MKHRNLERLLKACLVLLVCLTTAVNSRAAAQRPNIVFILADDLGYTDLACFGSKYYETPNIDRMAASGIRFTSGYTCGANCAPTRAALMSGQYAPRTGVYTVGSIERFDWRSRSLRPVDNVTKLPLTKITLAQSLKKAGYATAMFGKWHLGDDGPHHPGQRGFDEAIVSAGAHFNFVTVPPVEYPKGTYLADFLTDKAVDFIRRHQEGPFFLYLPHYAVHSPHDAKANLIAKFKPKPPVGGHNNPTYAAMIASVDESVGRVLALLDELKLAENTLVIFSSDNGGVGGYAREGIKAAGGITDNAPLRGGKGMFYEGGVRVPYIFRWPGRIPAGATCDQPINSVDLYPTLLEVAGAEPPANHPLDGVSYFKTLTSGGKAALGRDAIFWHFPGYLGAGVGSWRTTPAGAIRSGDWKLQEYFEDGHLELYNLREDLSQTNNLAAKLPDKAEELHARLTAWRQAVDAPMPTKNTEQGQPAKAKKGKKKRQKSASADK